jgi:hypothetical protein
MAGEADDGAAGVRPPVISVQSPGSRYFRFGLAGVRREAVVVL